MITQVRRLIASGIISEFNPLNNYPIIVYPIATVRNHCLVPEDHQWDLVESEIILSDMLEDSCLNGIDAFSHLEILFYFNRLDDKKLVYGERHPRDNPAFPLTGIYAQRGAARPNKIGATICRLKEKRTRSLIVTGLDAIDGSPVLDIKPVFHEFLPRDEIQQAAWVSELMKHYWK